jgi:hypothetical protein
MRLSEVLRLGYANGTPTVCGEFPPVCYLQYLFPRAQAHGVLNAPGLNITFVSMYCFYVQGSVVAIAWKTFLKLTL